MPYPAWRLVLPSARRPRQYWHGTGAGWLGFLVVSAFVVLPLRASRAQARPDRPSRRLRWLPAPKALSGGWERPRTVTAPTMATEDARRTASAHGFPTYGNLPLARRFTSPGRRSSAPPGLDASLVPQASSMGCAPCADHRPHRFLACQTWRSPAAVLVAAAVFAGIYESAKGHVIPLITAGNRGQTVRASSSSAATVYLIVGLSLAVAALRDRSAGWLTTLSILGIIVAADSRHRHRSTEDDATFGSPRWQATPRATKPSIGRSPPYRARVPWAPSPST